MEAWEKKEKITHKEKYSKKEKRKKKVHKEDIVMRSRRRKVDENTVKFDKSYKIALDSIISEVKEGIIFS